jgi:thiosulfate/3-mercaptopyruvate sulfurtransferase
MNMLVTTDWLAAHLGADDLVVLDCTVWLRVGEAGYEAVSGRDDWAAGHIPGAGFADLTGDLCDDTSPLRFALPTPEDFCRAMAALGVDDDRRVVLYDDNSSMWAARVWWMLRWVGFDRAAILDGGMKAWRAEGRPLDTAAPAPRSARLTPRVRPDTVADKAAVLAAIDDEGVCLVDALSPAMFRGEVSPYRRPGHIPGAVNAPAASLVDPETGRFHDLETLAAILPAEGSGRIVTYCGGGIAASADAFALTMLGHADVAVYTASMQEWSADPDAPLVVTTGSDADG